jgi:gliding motility-associated-like protein
VTITVNEKITPTFNSVNPICEGGTLSALPTTSLNGYTGVWSPALNNQDTTTYTFTPTAGQCASTAELTIVVNVPVIPNFTAVNPICEGETLTALPTTSTDGFTGSWSPALNNQDTTTYTFTPTAGQCAINAELTIVVNSLVTPDFVAVSPVCSGDTLDALPTTSTDGFTGSWSPALNNSATTTYTFTPNAGQCATNAELVITVNPLPEFTISEGCVGSSYTLSAIETDATNSTYEWYNPSNIQIGTESSVVVSTAGIYKLIVTKNGCSDEKNVNVLAPFCSIQKGISPNNDTENDNFDLSAYNVNNLKIFNRYGTTVYSKSSYQDEWYGQSDSGDELPDGTYYYVIDFADLETKTGWIYVNREQ